MDTDQAVQRKLSIAIPAYNEEENIEVLYKQLIDALCRLSYDYELIFVDDGSQDRTSEILAALHRRDQAVKVIRFSRNFGHQSAITAGMKHATGDALIIMDADLQDPPQLIPALVEKWQDGYDVVYAVRRKRKENLLKRAAYFTFYRLLGKIADSPIVLDSGDFALLSAQVVRAINSAPEHNRFVRGLRSWVGFHQIGIEYERDPRHCGQPKYSWFKLVKLATDGIFSFSTIPLRLASYLGFFTSIISLIYLVYAILVKVISDQPPTGWASLVASVLFIGGVQLIMLGIVGEYIGKIYDEVRGRPHYIISQQMGFDDDDARAHSLLHQYHASRPGSHTPAQG
jgi:polyisoprenyl-phosphate glycosyltransferase